VADKNFKVKTGLDLPQPLSAAQGGTGQSSLSNALNAMLPAQAGHTGKVLSSDGTNTTWLAQNVAYQRGNTASRPASPAVGDLYFNSELNYFESYTVNGWFPIAAAPTVPTSVVATDTPSGRAFNNGRASVAFSIGTNGGAPTSLVVTPTPATSPTTFTGSSSPIIVTGLSSSTQYTYTAYATSPYGTSAASSASSGVTATSVPQAPTIGAVTAGNATATVAYTTNATGGSAITTFTATSSPGALTGTGASPITVSGLTNDTSYTFVVTATNANGTSAASAASSAVTPISYAGPEGAFDALATVRVPSGGLTSAVFTGIPSGYKHLQIRGISRCTRSNINSTNVLIMRFNEDATTGNYYSTHNIFGNGANAYAQSIATVGATGVWGGASVTNGAAANLFEVFVTDILDYSNTNKNKITRSFQGSEDNGVGNGVVGMVSGLWLNTAPINTITLVDGGGYNFMQYSQFALYGVK